MLSTIGRDARGRADTGDLTIITSGVGEGDRVVTDGQFKLQANASVTLAPRPAAAGSPGTM